MTYAARVMVVDVETRSIMNLKRVGVTRYARHPSTSVLCLSWSRLDSNDEPGVWQPGEPMPADLEAHVARGGIIAAWNVAFDAAIWAACLVPLGWPALKLEQLHDIAAQAASASLPRGLEKCAGAIGLPVNKDREGKLALRALMAPQKWVRGVPVWRPADGERLAALLAYCRQDVVVERAAMRWLPPLQPAEVPVMLQDLRINQRGMRVDPGFLDVAGPFYERVLAAAHIEGERITRGAVPTITNTGAACRWLESLGVKLESTDAGGDDGDGGDEPDPTSRRGAMTKQAVRAYLARPDLPAAAREFLRLRQDTVRTSTAKLGTLAAATMPVGGRIHDTLTFHAASTGRAGGALLQPQNLPRLPDGFGDEHWGRVLADMGAVNRDVLDVDAFADRHGAPMGAVVNMLRGAIVAAPGCELVGGDFAQIELRVTAWLAGESKLLDMLAGGVDAYRQMAASIYGVKAEDVVRDQRQVGKSATLGCGFGLGAKKFVDYVLASTGLVIDPRIAERAVKAFRSEYRAIPELWRDLEATALEALHDQGKVIACADGRLAFWCSLGRAWLLLQLPSGRVLRYRKPYIEIEDNGVGPREVLHFWGVNQITRQWGVERSWGGPLCVAGETPVLTQRGWVRLDAIRGGDLLWDGLAWVGHGGLVCKGWQDVIAVDGVRMTPDHKVLTTEGWRHAALCEGLDRAAVRLPDGHAGRWQHRQATALAAGLRLREHENPDGQGTQQAAPDLILWVPQAGRDPGGADHARNVEAPGVRRVAFDVRPVPAADAPSLAQLRGPGDHGVPSLVGFHHVLAGHGADVSAWADAGAGGQRAGLQSGKLPLGDMARAGAQQAWQSADRHALGPDDGGRGGGTQRHRRDDTVLSDRGRRACVYDLLNTGPHHRFVVAGLTGPFLLHNCENAVQATARDLLVQAVLRIEARGWPVVLHIHDEALSEVPVGSVTEAEYAEEMARGLPWSAGLPVKVEAWHGPRYG